MIDLTKDEQDYKNAQEANFWFKQARDEHNRAERFAARIRELNNEVAKLNVEVDQLHRKRADDADRFEAISNFWHAARETGYNTSWSIGGVTVEKLLEETELARKYKTPFIILESDLVCVGKMTKDGEMYGKNVALKPGVPVDALYVYRPTTTAKVKGTKKP